MRISQIIKHNQGAGSRESISEFDDRAPLCVDGEFYAFPEEIKNYRYIKEAIREEKDEAKLVKYLRAIIQTN